MQIQWPLVIVAAILLAVATVVWYADRDGLCEVRRFEGEVSQWYRR